MPGGGLIQLIAFGSQDYYISGGSNAQGNATPQVTFWKSPIRRSTHFAVEPIELTFSGQPDFGKQANCVISRNGDLVHKMYLSVTLPALQAAQGETIRWTQNVGHALIKECELIIGGSRIDRIFTEWLTIWSELTTPSGHEDGFNIMIGNKTALTGAGKTETPATRLYIPLTFWFNRFSGLALPLIALQFHTVELQFTLRRWQELIIHSNGATPASGVPSLTTATVLADYVYLDSEERQAMAAEKHEILVTVTQHSGAESFNSSVVKSRMSFNHPTLALFWAFRKEDSTSGNRLVDFTNSDPEDDTTYYAGTHPMQEATILLNGNERLKTLPADYYGLVQPWQHFTRTPATGIYVYSFSLFPEQSQNPSGTLNLSRIDSAQLVATMNTSTTPVTLFLFALSYNVLRISSGMGGLAFSS